MLMGTLLGIARKTKTRAPMEEIESAEITEREGLEGDYRGGLRRRQITVLSRESWEAVCREVDRPLPWVTRRANLFIEGVALKEAVGTQLRIGEVLLEITGETVPCSRMDELCPGLRKALTPDWRGGTCCRVIQGGRIAIGDSVETRPPAAQ